MVGSGLHRTAFGTFIVPVPVLVYCFAHPQPCTIRSLRERERPLWGSFKAPRPLNDLETLEVT